MRIFCDEYGIPQYILDPGEKQNIDGIGTVTGGSNGSVVSIDYNNGKTAIGASNNGGTKDKDMTIITDNDENGIKEFNFHGNNINADIQQQSASAYIDGDDMNITASNSVNEVGFSESSGNNHLALLNDTYRVGDMGDGNVVSSAKDIGNPKDETSGYRTGSTASNSVLMTNGKNGSRITLSGENAFVSTGNAGDDININGTAKNSIIFTNGGMDRATDMGTNTYINMGADGDTIVLKGKNAVAELGDGNDFSFDLGENSTIDHGTGTSTLTRFANQSVTQAELNRLIADGADAETIEQFIATQSIIRSTSGAASSHNCDADEPVKNEFLSKFAKGSVAYQLLNQLWTSYFGEETQANQ